MTTSQTATIINSLRQAEHPGISDLSAIEAPDVVIPEALLTSIGRQWLRSLTDLTPEIAMLTVLIALKFSM